MPAYSASLPLLQNRLPLFRFFCAQLGAADGFKTLRGWLKDVRQGYGDEGHSFFHDVLAGQTGVRLPLDTLAAYDLRIKGYVEQLNSGRSPRVQLLYFQWLAALFSEWFLDRYFADAESLRTELNLWLNENLPVAQGVRFDPDDLAKVAFWMATGSGKTLLMHINLWQAQYYAGRAGRRFDNVLLVTPNEGLSRQHLEELAKSGIPARRYGESAGGLSGVEQPVTVIEITKLTENKRGGGLSVDVEAFGPNNLLFVDEGHRGASGETWRALRARVAERGFTFEYSATFGQIVNGASPDEKRRELLAEYSRAILFDYSYPHFYEDGYGKDYRVVNVRDETDTFNEWMLLANLVSFFEQTLAFAEHGEEVRPYAIERPLWVFVGHSVTGGKTREDQASLTDVEQIVAFFDEFLRHPTTWVKRLDILLAGESGLRDAHGEDLFQARFPYVRQKGWDGEQLYRRVVRDVFHGRAGETLRAAALKAGPGEIGLRVGAEQSYFGVINIGDVAGLMKLLEARRIACEEDTVHPTSLFDEINAERSPVNVLIGARKFMEGWDSFRVSSMGLMNIGRGEGSQIIQLFGRGVRLHGRDQSLKRSSALVGGVAFAPLRLLETLNIFGVRANYMQRFREELQKEGIETDLETIEAPIRRNDEFLKRGLQVLRLPDGVDFVEEEAVCAEPREPVRAALDLRPRLGVMDSAQGEERNERGGGGDRAAELRRWAPLLDWERIYFELLEYRWQAGMDNLAFTPASLRRIFEEGRLELYGADEQLRIGGFDDLRRAEDLAIALLRKYLANLHSQSAKAWEQHNLRLKDLTADDPNLAWSAYTVKVRRQFADAVRALVRDAEQLYREDSALFPRIKFDRHLYEPLLAHDAQGRYESVPPALNEGETRFVRDLRAWLRQNPTAVGTREVFLLRNLSRGHGFSFFSPKYGEAFYPDFMFWVIEDGLQTIAFIDPHGLGRARGLSDPKIQLRHELARMQPSLQGHSRAWRVALTSFILCPTPYDEARRTSWVAGFSLDALAAEHVLFMENDYIGDLWRLLLKASAGSGAGRETAHPAE